MNPRAKPTRIDVMIANAVAAPCIKRFEVQEDEMIPTHNVFRFTVGRQAMKEERQYAKQLLSLQKLFKGQVGRLNEGWGGRQGATTT